MQTDRIEIEGRQIVLHTSGGVPALGREIVRSEHFRGLLGRFVRRLAEDDSPLLEQLGLAGPGEDRIDFLLNVLQRLENNPLADVVRLVPEAAGLLDPPRRLALHRFVEAFYDFWRGFDRFILLRSPPGAVGHEHRPYRAFNATVASFTESVLGLYRDICENITGDHPRVYRQVAAGAAMGLICAEKPCRLPEPYRGRLAAIPFVRQVLINPPLILDPPVNARGGGYRRIDRNPLAEVPLDPDAYLCYPVQAGPLCIHVYFHRRFTGLACSLANLFELATDEQLARPPDAVYVYGVAASDPAGIDLVSNTFFDDEKNGLVAGFVPLDDRYGYFGYIKKMVLTLHNVAMMKRGRLPFHGAMSRLHLRGGRDTHLLLIGDTATGKSETLEALRQAGRERLRGITVVADDMGSIDLTEAGEPLGYGTETGAFIRLDDLAQGYAFTQIDRAIIMSPHKVNARVVLPVTTQDEVLHGWPIDYLLYANNYEQTDASRPVIERFETVDQALAVFSTGASLSKGTTTSTGLVANYFANIFGPPEYRELHDRLARRAFEAAHARGTFLGQMRTRLGLPGWEQKGPEAAARALLEVVTAGPAADRRERDGR